MPTPRVRIGAYCCSMLRLTRAAGVGFCLLSRCYGGYNLAGYVYTILLAIATPITRVFNLLPPPSRTSRPRDAPSLARDAGGTSTGGTVF